MTRLPSGGDDVDYPEWFEWAKRELAADHEHAHAAAQAAVDAGMAGRDQTACLAAATVAAAEDAAMVARASTEQRALAERLWAKRGAKDLTPSAQPTLRVGLIGVSVHLPIPHPGPVVLTQLGYGLSGAAVAFMAGVALLEILPGSPFALVYQDGELEDVVFLASQSLLVVTSAVLGALLVARQPSNILGWLFCAVALSEGLGSFAQTYAGGATVLELESLPGITFAAWVGSWVQIVSVPIAGSLIVLLAPDGRLPSHGWRSALWITVITLTYLLATAAFASGALRAAPSIDNPLGFLPTSTRSSLAGLVPVTIFLCAASAVARYRSASAEARQQLRWVIAATAVFLLAYIVNSVLAVVTGSIPGWPARLGAAAIALIAGPAILKYIPHTSTGWRDRPSSN